MSDQVAPLGETPWLSRFALPHRFSVKFPRYKELGGLVDIAADGRAYAGNGPMQDVERLIFLSLAFDQIHKENVPGDFLELGVYQGSTATVLAHSARRLDRHLYLLDTFEGFDSKDFNGIDAGRVVDFTNTSLETVKARVGETNTTYIKGYFPETAAQLPSDAQYCLVHIDVDLYAPILSGLEYFYHRLSPGGFLIVHDYSSLEWEGVEKAVDEFFADKPECVIPIPDSAGSVAIRRQRPASSAHNWLVQRQTLETDIWYSAANGALQRVLGAGWSAPEPWGVWGVGPSHTIILMVRGEDVGNIAVDLDVHAFIFDDTQGRVLDVTVNGLLAMPLVFTHEDNRKTVTLTSKVTSASRELTIALLARAVAAPSHVLTGNIDNRPLGMALHAIRLRWL